MNISGKKIELMLARNEMKQIQLAELAGYSRQSISTIVRRGTCTPETAGRIARALGVDVTELLED